MFPVSDRFLEAVRTGSGIVIVTADILVDGQPELEGLAVTDGSVTMAANDAVQRSGSLVLAEPTLLPVDSTSLLAPFGPEVRVWRGIDFGDGEPPEMVPIVTGPIQTSGGDLETEVTTVNFDDRSRWLIDDQVDGVTQITAGANVGAAIAELALASVPFIELAFASTDYLAPLLTLTDGADRWQAMRITLARSIGYELSFDGVGRLVFRSLATPSTPAWTIDDGAGGVLTGGALQLSRVDTANKVIATGGNSTTGEPFRGIAVDDNPASPTFYDGSFRHKPARVTASAAATQAATNDAAAAELERRKGVAKSFDVTFVANPALEPFDAVGIRRTLTAAAIDEVHVLDRATIGLAEDGAMSGTTRTVQVAT
jgi:hypothetical protein